MWSAWDIMLALALATALTLSPTFSLTAAQQQQTFALMHSKRPPRLFETASEAAYAAALAYGTVPLFEEIGAKIYVDYLPIGIRYSYGILLHGQSDPDTGDDEIAYPLNQDDGHGAVIGLWHEHPTGQDWPTLYGHDDDIRQTKQAVWTSLRSKLFVQYWDGREVVPDWQSYAEITPLCTGCVA